MAKEISEQEIRELANDRLMKFKKECLDAGIPAFSMGDNTKLKSAFMKTLGPQYGSKIKNAGFRSLVSDLYGAGIPSIEEYLDKLDDESFDNAGFGEEQPKAEDKKAIPEEQKTPEIENTAEKESVKETAEENEKNTSPKAEEVKKSGRKKKTDNEQLPAQRSSNLDVLLSPSTVRSVDRSEITRLKKMLNQLQYEKDYDHRQLTLYRRDLCILDALSEYGKKKSVNLVVDGTNLDGRVNILHAAISLLVKELDAQDADECFDFVKQAIAQKAEDDEYRNAKIAEVRKKLKEYEQ